MYYLMVLQVVAVYSSTMPAAWSNLGQFNSQQLCIEASRQLVKSRPNKPAEHKNWYDALPMVVKFECVKKD